MGPGEMSNEQRRDALSRFHLFRQTIMENDKTGGKEQDPERRCQASRQNSVEDSGPSGGRGGRESTSPASSPGDLIERNVDWEKLRFRAKRPEVYYPTLLGECLAEDGAVWIPPGR